MSITEIKGNIFTTKAQVIVNTVNCVGVMGAGIALEFRLRKPEMYRKYKQFCKDGKLSPGTLWLYKDSQPWVLNFPTKKDWKHPSRIEYLDKGLKKFVSTYREKGIESIAFPMLGADKGGISTDDSREIIRRRLSSLNDLNIEIYEYDPKAKDDLFDEIKALVSSQDIADIGEITKITESKLKLIIEAMTDNSVCQIRQLGALPSIGPKTLEKLFELQNRKTPLPQQTFLFHDDSSNINPVNTEKENSMSIEADIPSCNFCDQPGVHGIGKPKYKKQVYTCSEHRNLVQKEQTRTDPTP